MKLIAKTQTGYLAEVNENEVAQLLGHYNGHASDFVSMVRAYSTRDNLTGLEIDITQMYQMASMLRGLNKDNIADAKKQLERTQSKLKDLEDLVNKMTLLTTLKEA